MAGDGVMAFLESVVFSDVMKVITTDDDVVLHLVGDNDTLENSSSDGDVSSEGAFVVNPLAFNCFFGSLEAESDFLVESNTTASLFGDKLFAVKENSNLFLIGFFVLNVGHLW